MNKGIEPIALRHGRNQCDSEVQNMVFYMIGDSNNNWRVRHLQG